MSPCLFNFYAGYIIHSEGLDDSLAGIKIAGRNINNFRYTHDTILIAESELCEYLGKEENQASCAKALRLEFGVSER